MMNDIADPVPTNEDKERGLDYLFEDEPVALDLLNDVDAIEHNCDQIITKICFYSQICFEDPLDTDGKLSSLLKSFEGLIELNQVNLNFEQYCRLLAPLLFMCTELECLTTWKEACLIFNRLMSIESLVKVVNESEFYEVTIKKMGRRISSIGDFECQAILMESLVRISSNGTRKFWIEHWFSDEMTKNAFLNINPSDFERDCRRILNHINKSTKLVFSEIATSVHCGKKQLKKPYGSDLWIDFNYNSKCISFYVMDPAIDENTVAMTQWETIILHRDSIRCCYLVKNRHENVKSVTLILRLKHSYDVLGNCFSNDENSERTDVFTVKFRVFSNIAVHLKHIFGESFMGWVDEDKSDFSFDHHSVEVKESQDPVAVSELPRKACSPCQSSKRDSGSHGDMSNEKINNYDECGLKLNFNQNKGMDNSISSEDLQKMVHEKSSQDLQASFTRKAFLADVTYQRIAKDDTTLTQKESQKSRQGQQNRKASISGLNYGSSLNKISDTLSESGRETMGSNKQMEQKNKSNQPLMNSGFTSKESSQIHKVSVADTGYESSSDVRSSAIDTSILTPPVGNAESAIPVMRDFSKAKEVASSSFRNITPYSGNGHTHKISVAEVNCEESLSDITQKSQRKIQEKINKSGFLDSSIEPLTTPIGESTRVGKIVEAISYQENSTVPSPVFDTAPLSANDEILTGEVETFMGVDKSSSKLAITSVPNAIRTRSHRKSGESSSYQMATVDPCMAENFMEREKKTSLDDDESCDKSIQKKLSSSHAMTDVKSMADPAEICLTDENAFSQQSTASRNLTRSRKHSRRLLYKPDAEHILSISADSQPVMKPPISYVAVPDSGNIRKIGQKKSSQNISTGRRKKVTKIVFSEDSDDEPLVPYKTKRVKTKKPIAEEDSNDEPLVSYETRSETKEPVAQEVACTTVNELSQNEDAVGNSSINKEVNITVSKGAEKASLYHTWPLFPETPFPSKQVPQKTMVRAMHRVQSAESFPLTSRHEYSMYQELIFDFVQDSQEEEYIDSESTMINKTLPNSCIAIKEATPKKPITKEKCGSSRHNNDISRTSVKKRRAAVLSQKKTKLIMSPYTTSDDLEDMNFSKLYEGEPMVEKKKIFTDVESTGSDVSWIEPKKKYKLFDTPKRTYRTSEKKNLKKVTATRPKRKKSVAKQKKNQEENLDWINDERLEKEVLEYSSIEKFPLTLEINKKSSTTEFSGGNDTHGTTSDLYTEKVQKLSDDFSVNNIPLNSGSPSLFENSATLTNNLDIPNQGNTSTRKNKSKSNKEMRSIEHNTSYLEDSSRVLTRSKYRAGNKKNKKENKLFGRVASKTKNVNTASASQFASEISELGEAVIDFEVSHQYASGIDDEITSTIPAVDNGTKESHLERFLNDTYANASDVNITIKDKPIASRHRMPRNDKAESYADEKMDASIQVNLSPTLKMNHSYNKHKSFHHSSLPSTSRSSSPEKNFFVSSDFFEEMKDLFTELLSSVQQHLSGFYDSMVQYQKNLYYAINQENFEADYEGLSLNEQLKLASAHRRIVLDSISNVRKAMEAYIKANDLMEVELQQLQKNVLKQFAHDVTTRRRTFVDQQEMHVLSDLKQTLRRLYRRFQTQTEF